MRKLQVKLSVFRYINSCINVDWERSLATPLLMNRLLVHRIPHVGTFTMQAVVHPERHSSKGAQEEKSGAEQDILSHQGHKLFSP